MKTYNSERSSLRDSLRKFCASILLVLVIIPSVSEGADRELSTILANAERQFGKGSRFGISVRDMKSGEEVFSNLPSEQFLPASVLKLFATYVALKELGGNYTFKTTVAVDPAGVLSIRGGGDPTLRSEEGWEIIDEVRRSGVKRVKELVLDDTRFLDPYPRRGPNPYEAAQSALSFNQNSVAVKIYPTRNGSPAVVTLPPGVRSELTVKVQTVGGKRTQINLAEADSPTQKFIVSGTIGEDAPGVTLYNSASDARDNAGEILTEMFKRSGLTPELGYRFGPVPSGSRTLFARESKDLSFILADLNRYSSNFIANQLVYTLGCEGERCSFERGLERILDRLRRDGISPAGIVLDDGSGLSRKNRVSPEQLSQVLLLASRDLSIFPDFISSFSRYGLTGTMKSRPLAGGERVWAKTGTINGVSSLAGYLQSTTGRRLAFVIISNGSIPKPDAIQLEDGIVSALLQR